MAFIIFLNNSFKITCIPSLSLEFPCGVFAAEVKESFYPYSCLSAAE